METNIIKMIGPADIASLLNATSGMVAIMAAYYSNTLLTAIFLILAVLFDAVDGPIARKFPSPTNEVFGETIDSLADVISFGVAPAVILFEIYTSQYMIIASILILACGILRLSRYNTIITQQTGPTKIFIGLPIPVTSFTLSLFLFSQTRQELLILILMITIAILMVSTLEYPKIKDKKIFLISGILLLITLLYPINNMLCHIPSYLLLLLVIIYIISPIRDVL
ncbi:MAG: CDP-diacylglycerol--serine O-phosphatidyltransferase [Methanosphaera sp. rholeuAM270]|nr:MAG: CDP-diacylglycerol--serine O-phosphatidyltransferase [Methanosphaera sp. rholeuAM270]